MLLWYIFLPICSLVPTDCLAHHFSSHRNSLGRDTMACLKACRSHICNARLHLPLKINNNKPVALWCTCLWILYNANHVTTKNQRCLQSSDHTIYQAIYECRLKIIFLRGVRAALWKIRHHTSHGLQCTYLELDSRLWKVWRERCTSLAWFYHICNLNEHQNTWKYTKQCEFLNTVYSLFKNSLSWIVVHFTGNFGSDQIVQGKEARQYYMLAEFILRKVFNWDNNW